MALEVLLAVLLAEDVELTLRPVAGSREAGEGRPFTTAKMTAMDEKR